MDDQVRGLALGYVAHGRKIWHNRPPLDSNPVRAFGYVLLAAAAVAQGRLPFGDIDAAAFETFVASSYEKKLPLRFRGIAVTPEHLLSLYLTRKRLVESHSIAIAFTQEASSDLYVCLTETRVSKTETVLMLNLSPRWFEVIAAAVDTRLNAAG